jgi:sialic acid synthase SpsE
VNWTTLDQAKAMIYECKKLGIKFAKFQVFRKAQVPLLVYKNILDKKDCAELFAYGQLEGVEVFFTPFYAEAVDMLEDIGVHYYKIRHRDRYNSKLRLKVKLTGKPTFISIDGVMDIPEGWTPLLCIPEYPASVLSYINHFDRTRHMGISDHTPSLSLYQIHKVAHTKWFEMHVCLDKNCYEANWSKTFKEIQKAMKA